jgi:hypothetical protein
MHLRAGIARRGLAMRVRHVVELLDEAYAASAGAPITPMENLKRTNATG